MRFRLEDARAFTAWSGDHHPPPVEHGRVAHGAPDAAVVRGIHTVIDVLRILGDAGIQGPLAALEAEFRGQILADEDYDLAITPGGSPITVRVAAGDRAALTLSATTGASPARDDVDASWTRNATTTQRTVAASLDVSDLLEGATLVGTFDVGAPPHAWAERGPATPGQLRVLALCSYVAGMEVPGCRGLLTRLAVTFARDADLRPLVYRIRVLGVDRAFRMVRLAIDVATQDGVVVAQGELQSYVRFSPRLTDLDGLAHSVTPPTDATRGRVALVCGGSRGLGASLAAALALRGYKVYASHRSSPTDAAPFRQSLETKGLDVEFIQGDAGDPRWCSWTLNTILERHGRLDVLVLNACAAPPSVPLRPDAWDIFEEYGRANLRLVQLPLTTMLPALRETGGTVVAISSAVVGDRAPLSGASRSLKLAVEGLMQSAAAEYPDLRCIVARPGRLQTAINDTPTRVVGALPPEWVAAAVVNRIAATEPGDVDVLSAFAEPDVSLSPSDAGAVEPDFVMPVAASFTVDPILRPLGFWFEQLGVRGDSPLAPYGQIIQTLLDPRSVFGRNTRGVNVVFLRVHDWLRELPPEQRHTPDALSSYLDDTAAELERAVIAHRQTAKADTLLVLCPGGDVPPAVAALLARTEQRIVRVAKGVSGLSVVVAEDLHERYGVRAEDVADTVRDHMAHVPYRDGYFHVLATLAVRHASRRLLPLRKVIVVDCDNTLWRGVVGEVGPDGVAFDPPHLALHATLQDLVRSGVLLCLCSKNEESDVWEVFDTRPDFTLKRDAIVAAAINWLPKSQNIRTLAARLNLGLDSFIFLDDNPVECAEVRAGCPEVLTLQWPQDADDAARLLSHTWELDAREATLEDLRRTAMYQEEFKRQELRDQTLTFQDFLDNLQLVVDIAPMSDDDLKRSSQLTLRTNQFNFTTKRRNEAELLSLRSDGSHEIFTVRVRDRFGDYGLVGLLVVAEGDGHVLVDTFLLSCRVLGRGVEHRMAAAVARRALDSGRSFVRMRVETTKKNKPARDFLLSILPNGVHDVTDAHVDVALDASWLATLTFEASDAPVPVDDAEAAKGATAVASTPGRAFNPRQREAQIARTAALATLGDLCRAIDGEGTPAAAPPRLEDVALAVYDAFAHALQMSAARVREVNSIEALGCDSFKIVEISVSLIERFPNLPSTLLFEHRTVSEIIDEIARRASTALTTTRGPGPSLGDAPIHDIAVVGLHLRCAGARSADELWALLSEGRSAVTAVPTDRPHFVRPLQDRRPHWGALVDDLDGFDAEFFGVSPREAESMDPQLRVFLEVAWGALEDAGNAGRYADPHTGVFVGVMYGDYVHRANRLAQAAQNPYRSWEGFSIANRLSQVLGFDGPSLAVDTACSSSGTALHLACRAIADGDCRTAIVGGVNAILDPDRFVQLGILGILSHTGRCQAFGADADGTVLGEGVGVVVLRSLAEAQARGDRIYGVIKGTGLSTGAGTVGFTAPHPRAQSDAIRRALQVAAVDPRTISYVETHGTGTALGDPIEVRGLTLAYDDRTLWSARVRGEAHIRLGSIKPNIGHLEAGAGVMGLIKLMLQLERRQLLPSLTSPALNPQIPFAQLPFDVQRSLEAWEAPVFEVDGVATPMPRRAGLNSFGVGGANAHAIVEEAPGAQPRAVVSSPTNERPLHVLAVSAKSHASLLANAAGLARLLGGPSSPTLADVAYTANTLREHFEHRLAVIATDAPAAAALLAEAGAVPSATGVFRGTVVDRPKVAFLFTGQGAQYPGMGRELYDTQPTFRRVLDECASALEGTLDVPLLDVMFATAGSPAAPLIHRTAYTQPALFALEYAMGELLREWGVKPDVVIGHSVGEIAALAWAGALPLGEAIALVAARGRLMEGLPDGGQMCSIMTTEARVTEALNGIDGVCIAAVNGPTQVVVAGDGSAVTTLAARFAAQGVRTQTLTVSHAFHSHLMDPMTAEFANLAARIPFTRTRVPVVSCVTGSVLVDEYAAPEYWVRQVRDPVRFVTGMDVLRDTGITAFIETGPHAVLLAMGRHCLGDDAGDRLWLPSLRRDASAWTTLTGALAQLHVAGAAIDWTAFDTPFARARVPLPTYAFTHKSYWLRAGGVPSDTVDDAQQPAAITPGARAARSLTTYRFAWHRSPRTAPSRPSDRQHIVVLADENGLGAVLADALRSRGAHATVLHHGHALGGGLVVDAADRLVLARVWDTLASAKPAPTGLVWLWGVTASSRDASSADDVRAARHQLFDRLTPLVASLAQSPFATTPLTLVTRGGAAVDADGTEPTGVDIIQSMVWGFARTIALEHPGLWGGIVDLPADSAPAFGASLADEVLARDDEDQVALRGSERLVPRLTAFEPAGGASITLSPDGVYIVTGGLGALGLRVAQWMAARSARHILLTSRRGVQTAHARAAIGALEARGVRVRVVSADIASADDVTTVMRVATEHGAAVRGIVHAAGADLVAPMTETTRAQFDAVAAPKVEGTWLLAESGRRATLDFFLCFSSIAAVLGSAGRAAYAAANAAEDALPFAQPREHGLVSTIAWGPWAGGGMADQQSLRDLAAIGNHGLDPDAAIAAMEGVLARRVPHATVADIDWSRFKPVYEARRPRPLVAHVSSPASATSGAPSLAPGSAWGALLTNEPLERRREVLTSLLAMEVARTLGLRSGADVPADKTFHQMGMDSLLAVQFGAKLEAHLGFRSTSLVFDYPRLADLTAHVLERVSSGPASGEAPARSIAARGVADASSEWMQVLAETPTDQRPARLEALLRKEIADTLGFANAAAVDESKTFSHLGMDSLLAVQFAARLERRLGVRRPSVVFDYPTLPQLAAYLLGEVDVVEAPSTRGLVRFTSDMETEVLAFQRDTFTYRRPELIAPRWRWMFKESAARLGLEPRVWLFRDTHHIVAHHGALPVRLKAGAEVLTTAWWVDTKVRDEYQSEAIGPRLVLRGNDDLDFSLSLGQTKQMRDILLLVGHVQVAPLETAQLLLEPHTVLSAKMSAPAAMAAAIGLQASSAVLSVLRTKIRGEVAHVTRFDARHDELWRQAARDLPCAVVRDASYLNWKYVEQPGQHFTRLEIVEDGRTKGVVVLMFRKRDDVYPYDRAFIVDLVAPFSDKAVVNQLIGVAIDAASEHGAATLTCLHIGSALTRALRRHGFMIRDPQRYLLVYPGSLVGEARDVVLDGRSWYVTHGDSDIDRP